MGTKPKTSGDESPARKARRALTAKIEHRRMASVKTMKKTLKRYQRIQKFQSTSTQAEQALLSERQKKFDPKAKTDDMIADLRTVQGLFPNMHITRNIYRLYGKFSDSTWDSRFGTFLEFRKQAGLELNRGQQKLERDIAKHASLDVYRGFYEVEVAPWVGKYEKKFRDGGNKVIVASSDWHDTEADPFVAGVFMDTIKRIQPDIIVFGGDIFDCYEFSRFDKDPRTTNVAARMSFARDKILGEARRLCPNAQIDFILGNHEFRLLKHMADRTPYMRSVLSDFMGLSFADMLGLTRYKINLISKVDLAAYNIHDVREEVNKNYKTYFGCWTFCHYGDDRFGTHGCSGHTHKPKLASDVSVRGNQTWVTMGCISRTNPEYITMKSRYMNSFCIVHIDTKTGQVVQEHVVFEKDFAVVSGQYYHRKDFQDEKE